MTGNANLAKKSVEATMLGEQLSGKGLTEQAAFCEAMAVRLEHCAEAKDADDKHQASLREAATRGLAAMDVMHKSESKLLHAGKMVMKVCA